MEKLKAFVTPVGSTMWASITKPNFKFDVDGKYMMDMVFKPEEVVGLKKKLDRILDEYVAEESKNLKANKASSYTVSPVFKEEADQEGNLTGDLMLRSKQFTKTFDGEPQTIRLADSTGKPLLGFEKNIGNGSKVRAKLFPKCYHMNSTNTYGMTFLINAVQIIDLVEYEDGGDSFDAVEGGFKDKEEVGDDFEDMFPPSKALQNKHDETKGIVVDF